MSSSGRCPRCGDYPCCAPREVVMEKLNIKDALVTANDMCRSMMAIVEREGESTNWKALKNKLAGSLLVQHKIMLSAGMLDGRSAKRKEVANQCEKEVVMSELTKIKCNWCNAEVVPKLSRYGAKTCQFVCHCGHQLSIPGPKELADKYNNLLATRHRAEAAEQKLAKYAAVVESAKKRLLHNPLCECDWCVSVKALEESQ